MKRPHGKVVGTAVVVRELFFEIHQRVEGMAGIEPLLVLTVTSLHLTVVPGRVRPDELMSYAEFLSGGFKQSGNIPL